MKGIVFAILFLAGFSKVCIAQPTDMEAQAKEIVEAYLMKNDMPVENLEPYNSLASPKPDYAFLYTGGGRCIEFIINCWDNRCGQLGKYPFDEHGEKCPITRRSMSPAAGQP